MTDLKSNKKRKGHPLVINPVGEFCLPITLPDDPEWVAAFINAVRKLSNRSTWDYDASGDYIALADRWKDIADTIQLAYQGGLDCADVSQPDEGTCTTLSAHHPAVSYWPNNPVLQPDEPGPYSSRVWRVGNPINPFERPGDSYIDPLAFLGIPLSEVFTIGLPYWHIAFEGSGEVDIGLIQVLQGGAMWVFPDNNPLAGDLVSLQYIDIEELAGVEALLSLLEILGQSDFQIVESVHTVEFTTPGEHSLTGWMIPTVEPAPPFLGIGGGLRSIQLCGDITVIEDTVIPYTLDAQPDGTIRLLADGSPVSTLDLKALLDDDYVNIEGDTMTGALTINNDTAEPTGAKPALVFQSASERKSYIEPSPGGTSWKYDYTKQASISAYGGAGSQMLWGAGFIRQLSSDADTSGMNAGLMFAANNNISALDLKQQYDAAIIQRWIQASGLVTSRMDYSGLLRALAIAGYDYSSAGLWRQQFGLSGDWLTATDAIRQGIVKLDVSGFDGDHEVFTAEYGESILDLPSIAFFGGTPNTRQPLTPTSPDAMALAIADQLNAYSLTDITLTPGFTSVDETLNPAQLCSAAYGVATGLATLIGDIIDNLLVITPTEMQTGLIDDYGIPASLAYQLILALSADTLNGDVARDSLITDVDAVAQQLQVCDFDRACFFDWMETLSMWGGAAVDIIEQVLVLVWDTLVPFWQTFGVLNPDEGCQLFVWPCQDFVIDYRYGPAPGGEIKQGVTNGDGLRVAPSGPNWGSWVNIYFDTCQIDYVEVDVLVNYLPQFLRWAWYQGPIGSETEQGNSTHGTLSPGPQTITINLAANASDTTKLTIRFENEGTEDADNVIYQIRVYME